MRIAIGHDLIERHTDGNSQSFSAMWKAQADQMGIEAEVIDPMLPGAIERIGGYDAFIWRYNFQFPWTEAGPRILSAVEDGYGLPVWPPRQLRLIFENKVAQTYLLDALDVPRPRTWVFWSEAAARAALPGLPLPLVAKLSRGMHSSGVALVRTPEEALTVARQMFSFGLDSMEFLRNGKGLRWGKYTPLVHAFRRGRFRGDHQRGYVMFQEFVPDNAFDTRVVVQGDRAWASRRMVREGDFRASGSGVSDLSAQAIDPAALELSWRLADAMGVRSLVTDVMKRDGEPVMGEFSYTMAAHVVRIWEGHWLRGPDEIVWVDAPLDWPRAVFEDFVAEVRSAGNPEPRPAA
jgi:glutathione synthase/RimK-type ligase-like ATP-grasp enzyme